MVSAAFNDFSNSVDAYLKVIGDWLDDHPTINKVVIVVNHLFRALAMATLITLLPYSHLVNCGLTLAASLFYRVTVERCCPFRFALHSCAGGAAMVAAQPALIDLVAGLAFESLQTLGRALLQIAPLGLYLGWVVYISSLSVDARIKPEKMNVEEADEEIGSCCCK